MHCDQIQLYLKQYVEGSLPGYKAAWVVQHLAACPSCTAAADAARREPAAPAPVAGTSERDPHPSGCDFEAVQRPVPRWLQWATAIFIVTAVGGAVWLVAA